jgi:large subunit ribosomal protein L17
MAAHRKALHRNMVTSLFRYERIRTTKAKAQEVRRSAEKLITRAKLDTVHNRRIVSSRLFDEGVVAKLFTDIALRMKERAGGYTRIIKLGERQGDASEVVILELVDYKLNTEEAGKKAGKDGKADKNAPKDKGEKAGKKEKTAKEPAAGKGAARHPAAEKVSAVKNEKAKDAENEAEEKAAEQGE